MATLKDILNKKAEQAERADRPKVDWFTLKPNQEKRIKFLQELDTDMRNYDSTRGTALFLVEHTSAEEYTRRAECSFEAEGRCFACEMDEIQPSIEEKNNTRWHPWGQKTNMYIHVVDEDGKVTVLSRSAPGKFFDAIYEEAVEENDNSLTDLTFKIKKGPQQNSPWEIKATKQSFEVPEIAELVDLETAVGRKVPYADQKKFYLPKGVATEAPAETPKADTATDSALDW